MPPRSGPVRWPDAWDVSKTSPGGYVVEGHSVYLFGKGWWVAQCPDQPASAGQCAEAAGLTDLIPQLADHFAAHHPEIGV